MLVAPGGAALSAGGSERESEARADRSPQTVRSTTKRNRSQPDLTVTVSAGQKGCAR
ncbi:hypothetical protein Stsp02_11700 [Streptomyces sp. NBRC 14336]|nr:hypothetical protein Stsp02_11700 [Streptomyces sp. NBRC 14336]